MYFLLYSLLVTIFLEFLVIWILLQEKPARTLLYTILINSFTLPLATYSYYYIIPNLIVIELGVILLESLLIMLLFKIKYSKALIISAVANLVTAVVGVLIFLSLHDLMGLQIF